MPTLFGSLASKFANQPENIATESLNYIITRSDSAKQAFLHYIAQTTVELSHNLRFQTQEGGSDNVIPDKDFQYGVIQSPTKRIHFSGVQKSSAKKGPGKP
jgi:hypothetical protein